MSRSVILSAVLTLFYELAGLAAKSKLKVLQQQLSQDSAVTMTRLLENLEQPDLYLLVVEAMSKPDVELLGARVWVFHTPDPSN